MALNAQQRGTVLAAIKAVPEAEALRAGGNVPQLRDWLNSASTFVVWRKNVTRAEVYHSTSADGTTWSWTTYKNQSVAEQNAWTQMFMGDVGDFSLANLRAGVAAIFTGSAQANAQRDHAYAVAKRAATQAEKVLASGAGTTAVPGVGTFYGSVGEDDAVWFVQQP